MNHLNRIGRTFLALMAFWGLVVLLLWAFGVV